MDVLLMEQTQLTYMQDLAPADPKDYVANVISVGATIVALDGAGAEIKAVVTGSNSTTGANYQSLLIPLQIYLV